MHECFNFNISNNITFQNKEFVYRGDAFERLSTFQDRLKSEYPSATFMNLSEVSDNIKKGDNYCKY